MATAFQSAELRTEVTTIVPRATDAITMKTVTIFPRVLKGTSSFSRDAPGPDEGRIRLPLMSNRLDRPLQRIRIV
jgi:hypothetical protein